MLVLISSSTGPMVCRALITRPNREAPNPIWLVGLHHNAQYKKVGVLTAQGTMFPAVTFPTDDPNSDLERCATSNGKHHRPAPPLRLCLHTDAMNSTPPPSSSTVAARAQPPSTFVMATGSSSSALAPPSTDGLYHLVTPPLFALSLSFSLVYL
jgi:hypothetical protein